MSKAKVNSETRSTAKRVDFGFRDVTPDEKNTLVGEVFSNVARRYDLMNDVMSAGVHRIWKSHFIREVLKSISPARRTQSHAIDVAGGTGDIAFRLLAKGVGRVSVADPSAEMMAVGEERALDAGYVRGVDWTCAPAENLPFAGNSFDFYTISFGLRNVTDRAAALEEAYRVLKPGSAFYCLEFSQCQLPGIDKLYELYAFNALPKMGKYIARDEEAYRYLAESIAKFPTQEQLADMMKAAGFARVSWQNLSGGIAAIHKGWKI